MIEGDPGVQARAQAIRQALTTWWGAQALRLADLPARRNLNAVRNEFLRTFTEALLALGALSRYKLAGVIATWWTDALPELKTLMENGFAGVIDGWADAIADAVEDDDADDRAFDPFGHRLVRRVMPDYLDSIAAAKAEIARWKGEKEAFEGSNPPDDAGEDELDNWNYAKDLERQMRELKSEHREAMKALTKLKQAVDKPRKKEADRAAASDALREAQAALQPALDRIAALEDALAPYEAVKARLSEARAHYRKLVKAFVEVLQVRCGGLSADERRDLVLALFAEDVQAGLDAAVSERRQELVRFVEGLWDKYRVTLTVLNDEKASIETRLNNFLRAMRYV